jgi:hypothetical protein
VSYQGYVRVTSVPLSELDNASRYLVGALRKISGPHGAEYEDDSVV